MGCSHCMDDARADSDKFMSLETFKKALAFNLKYDNSITLTGGEPTEHPQFWEFMDIIAETLTFGKICTVTTNGMNLSDNDIPKVESLKEKCRGHILWQVSSIRPYYPIRIDTDQKIFQRKEFYIARKIEALEYRGRAMQHPEWIFQSKAPRCFNIRSFMRNTMDFATTVFSLRSMNKFCTPQIAYDGSIKLGESTLCPAASHIDKSISDIEHDLINFTCACPECHKLLDKLPAEYRAAIGET
jgi:MoaA/NifB/PqqE/SkfB family radical SAM enzyme